MAAISPLYSAAVVDVVCVVVVVGWYTSQFLVLEAVAEAGMELVSGRPKNDPASSDACSCVRWRRL